MSKDKKIKLGISIGDINGIGLEVIIKCFQDSRMFDSITPIAYGVKELANQYRKQLSIEDFGFNHIKEVQDANPKRLNMVDIGPDKQQLKPGESTEESGRLSFKSLERAVNDLASNKIDVLVTAPINKKNIHSNKFEFPGHTEYLAKVAGTEDVLMFMISENMRVGVVTGHIPVNEVSKSISKNQIIRKLRVMNSSLIKDFNIVKPKIAVLGLNPHAGDGGLLGKEEIDIIIPAIESAKNDGMLVFGPYSADGFFGSSTYKEFDAILAMYHDQGLIPFKSLTFENGINFTAGLPVVRTSPDHGTAYEIAGQNMASPSSFRAACFAAIDIFKNRKYYKEINENPIYKKNLSKVSKEGSGD